MGAPIFALILYIIAYVVVYKIELLHSKIIVVIGFSSVKISKRSCSDQTSNSLISVLRCHPWISNADTTQYLEDL